MSKKNSWYSPNRTEARLTPERIWTFGKEMKNSLPGNECTFQPVALSLC